MRTIIIGGGIGGLALAAGLRRHGLDVTVHERDTDLAATGGYHITLDTAALAALRALVGPEHLERLLASASAVRRRPPDVWWDWRARPLGPVEVKGLDRDSVDVDRITLRLLLAEAAGDALHVGRTCVGVERELAPGPATGVGATGGGGPVRARFADGTVEHGDLLVGADGTGSLVARHLAGGPTSRPAGVLGVSGRTAAAALDPDERERLGPRSSLGVGPAGTALYAGFLDPEGFAVLDAAPQRAAVTVGPTYIWGVMVPDTPDSAAWRGLSGAELRDATLGALRRVGWSERALQVVARTGTDGVAAYRFHAGPDDVREMAPWPAGPITALGDAVHATPPTAGKGAGTALVDAAALLEGLLAVRAGTTTPLLAVSAFEQAMRHRGTAVVALSMVTVRRVLASSTPAGSALTRASLPLLAGATALRTRRERRG
ncbi:FAD-dependent oxidoreductase [Cellulomonas endophytica]|uniref:FAD-dependent oxidoreductase n=1 Tax=Cellulomonas endophytica TaxID=2494735 RepID=UPI00101168BE|nr:FAD-dependent monooxygenase [Cellulomonas endophytica]